MDEQTAARPTPGAPNSKPLVSRGLIVRLFLTCWLVYALHFATNTVREIYLALSIGDDLSFRVDDYGGIHPDLFEKPGFGWHIGANPGASMLAALPYAAARPLIDRIVGRVNESRAKTGSSEPPRYNSPWPMAREFYRRAWQQGLDIKFGLAAFVMHFFCMAPISALGAVAMFLVLSRLHEQRAALWLTLLFAFGTPVFFRTGYLNHNLMLGFVSFAGWAVLWNPSGLVRLSHQARVLLAGLAGGLGVLLDYSGLIPLLGLFLYGLYRLASPTDKSATRVRWRSYTSLYGLGAAGPILLLWFYQWQSFGHPFYPGQHWMPPVEWIELGYQGFTWPQAELLALLAFDYRYGLFLTCPLFLLALAAPWVAKLNSSAMKRSEVLFALAIPAALWLFFGGVQYTRLQYGTGMRYLAAGIPFLFIAASMVLVRLPRPLAIAAGSLSVIQAWSMAMYRDVERGFGLAEPLIAAFSQGLQLPALGVLSRIEGPHVKYFTGSLAALALYFLAAMVLYMLWRRAELPAFREE